jgi:hypothetical protein
MADNKYIVVDKIKWFVWTSDVGKRYAQPLCPTDHLRLQAVRPSNYDSKYRRSVKIPEDDAVQLECAEGPHRFDIPRKYSQEQQFVLDKLDAMIFAKQTFIYLDDVAVPVAGEMLKETDSPVWVKTRVTDSKSGLRLIVWAGTRAAKNKTQLFVEPELKRLGFDQNDDHPLEVFAKVEATFAQGVTTEIRKDS